MSYKAWYNQDADYNTNAKSYMDYLARHNKFMKVLVEDYEVFKELLTEEFKQFQHDTSETIQSFQDRLDNIQQEMTDLFTVWVNDGTITHLINEEIFSMKADKIDLEELEEVLRTHYDGEIDQITKRLDRLNMVNVKDFDVVGDGITDDTLNIQNALDLAYNENKTLFFPNGVYACNNIEIKTPILMGGSAEFKFNGSSGATLLTISAVTCYYPLLNVNGDNKDCTLIVLNGHHNLIDNIVMKNITVSDITPNHVFGFMNRGKNNKIKNIHGQNFKNNGYSNGSFPQAILNSNDDETTKNILYIGEIYLQDIVSGLVTTNNSLVYVQSLIIERAKDNGIYNLGGSSLNIDYISYNGNEEPAVFTGEQIFINSFYIKGSGSRIGFQNVAHVRINHIHIEKDENNKTVGSLFRTRESNNNTGEIYIGKITGELHANGGGQLWLLDVGIIESFTIEEINLIHYYHEDFATISRYAPLLACEQIDIKNVKIDIIDLHNQFNSDDLFYIRIPTLLKSSYLSNIQIKIFNRDYTTSSPANLRISGIAQENLQIDGIPLQVNIGPFGRDLSYGLKNTMNRIPDSGYWHRNELYYSTSMSESSPIGWVCIESGTPGVWREL